MRVTNLQKILLGVLGVGVVVLARDAISSPQPALAGETAAASGVVEVAGVPVVSTERPSKTVSQRLRELPQPASATDQIPDAFVSLEGPSSPVADQETFQSKHQLTGVMLSVNKAFAVVNGQTLRPGQMLDGYRLVSIGSKSATFQSGNDRLTLALVN